MQNLPVVCPSIEDENEIKVVLISSVENYVIACNDKLDKPFAILAVDKKGKWLYTVDSFRHFHLAHAMQKSLTEALETAKIPSLTNNRT